MQALVLKSAQFTHIQKLMKTFQDRVLEESMDSILEKDEKPLNPVRYPYGLSTLELGMVEKLQEFEAILKRVDEYNSNLVFKHRD